MRQKNSLLADFPIFAADKQLVYLDNAATTLKPKAVVDAISEFYTFKVAPIYRGIYSRAEDATNIYESARLTVAQFINANSDEIVFTKGTTESINLLAYALENYFEPGDEIILSELEHHANLVPWQELAKRKKIIIKFIRASLEGELILSDLESLITDNTKLISIVHCSNSTGAITDINLVVKHARKMGILVALDAAQSAPHMLIDVKNLDIDFLMFSGHKMLAPTGIGIFYANKRVHNLLNIYQTGGGMVFNVDYNKTDWRDFPHKFEAGSLLIGGAIGLKNAIEYIQNNINFEALKIYEANLCEQLIIGLEKLNNAKILGPRSQLVKTGHLVSFNIDKYHPHDVASYLDKYSICVRAGNQCAQPFYNKLGLDGSIRVSFYFYNTAEDVDKLLYVLGKL